MSLAHIANRKCLYIHGTDAEKFLQGMITNDIALLESRPALYACFLTPQGKFLYDFLITVYQDGYLLEVLDDDIDGLKKRFKIYALRDDIQLKTLDGLKVYAFWGEGTPPENRYQDPRLPALGYRIVQEEALQTDKSFEDYDLHRIRLGVPDGSRDLKPEISTMYDGNLDLLNAVSFNKGCFLGQELTARVHYRGLVKRRMFPFTCDAAPESLIIKTEDGRLAGEIHSYQQGDGLALLKLALWDAPLQSEDGAPLSVDKPEWLTL